MLTSASAGAGVVVLGAGETKAGDRPPGVEIVELVAERVKFTNVLVKLPKRLAALGVVVEDVAHDTRRDLVAVLFAEVIDVAEAERSHVEVSLAVVPVRNAAQTR